MMKELIDLWGFYADDPARKVTALKMQATFNHFSASAKSATHTSQPVLVLSIRLDDSIIHQARVSHMAWNKLAGLIPHRTALLTLSFDGGRLKDYAASVKELVGLLNHGCLYQ
jgi:hypothetical protein